MEVGTFLKADTTTKGLQDGSPNFDRRYLPALPRYLITVTHLQRGLQEVWKVASDYERQGRRTRPQPGMAKMGNTEAVTDSLGVYEVVQGKVGNLL